MVPGKTAARYRWFDGSRNSLPSHRVTIGIFSFSLSDAILLYIQSSPVPALFSAWRLRMGIFVVRTGKEKQEEVENAHSDTHLHGF